MTRQTKENAAWEDERIVHYLGIGDSFKQIGERLGLSKDRIRKVARSHGFKAKPRTVKWKPLSGEKAIPKTKYKPDRQNRKMPTKKELEQENKRERNAQAVATGAYASGVTPEEIKTLYIKKQHRLHKLKQAHGVTFHE